MNSHTAKSEPVSKRLHVGNGENELCLTMPDHTTGIHCGISKNFLK
jgi:hypothetical protein